MEKAQDADEGESRKRGRRFFFGGSGEKGRQDTDGRRDAMETAAKTPARRRRAKPVERAEVEALWAAVMRDEEAGVKDRMHAAELCARALDEREQRQREQADRQQDAAVGRLDEVLRALWGCRSGEWDG